MSDAPDNLHYRLYYWPFLQGRGEFVRLVLEAAGAAYTDVARLPKDDGGGVAAIQTFLRGEQGGLTPLAPPFLQVGDLVLAQTANICLFLARHLGLIPDDEGAQAEALQLLLTVADFVTEIHDTHHPVSSTLPYEDQKPEAVKRAHLFVEKRLPRFLGYFDKTIEKRGAEFALGSDLSCVDLALFQLVAGTRHAFPAAFARIEADIPRVIRVHDRVAEQASISAYLASERRLPFNLHGIFRQYPELDLP